MKNLPGELRDLLGHGGGEEKGLPLLRQAGDDFAHVVDKAHVQHSRVNKRHTPIRALVLTPTRELALQIKESFDQYGKYLDIRNTRQPQNMARCAPHR